MDTKNSTATPPSEANPSADEAPHACVNGWVWVGQMVVGEEVEEYAMYLCGRCAGLR